MTQLFGLDLRARRVVVVGGGPVAARRGRALRAAGAVLVIVSPALGEELTRMVGLGEAQWHQRAVREQDLLDAWFVVAATDDRAVNERVARWADRHRVWCINASDGASGSARQAATSRHAGLVVAVASAGDVDPARVRAVREAVGAHLDSGRVDLRRRRVHTGRVVVVGMGPGEPDLVTVRGRHAAAEADVVVAEASAYATELAGLDETVQVIDPTGEADGHGSGRQDLLDVIVERAQRGLTVVRLAPGEPAPTDDLLELERRCRSAGVSYEIVPGLGRGSARRTP
jgi:uroporphyrin-III C-methyltransferase/precorrin-2 dehydrogenase/sirohydrochlorin ferrochelatase